MDPGSTATTLAGEHAVLSGPFGARLDGYSRAWNVAVPSGPGERRPLFRRDGTPFEGDVASLGLTPGGSCLGVVYGVTAAALDLLDARELRYDRLEVTGAITRLDGKVCEAPVFTYHPKPAVPARCAALLAAGRIVVTAEYLGLVAAGIAALGPEAAAEYAAEALPPGPVADLWPAPDDDLEEDLDLNLASGPRTGGER